ncbi:hypothetical protein DdX_12924 [Ditylenchus destructor]|uniref:F-box domain-containing protein n=1 Tax=Ditylenchus destructor TaxID=166010 RepID=A0AAD4MXY8_9BILA|nr:hypothetical protein DdX_12924 [Ditylenchus destructor]
MTNTAWNFLDLFIINKHMRRFFGIKKKHRKCQISLSTDILMDVLRHFSRKQICRLIYTVNRQLYSLATSPSYLPLIHFIDGLSFGASQSLVHEPQSRLCTSKPNDDYYVRIETSRGIQTLPLQAFAKMPKPGHLIRFRRVFINRYLEEPVLNFLNDTSASFIGCQLRISIPAPILKEIELSLPYVHHKVLIPQSYSTNQARSQVQHLLQYVFRKPSWVSICDTYLIDTENGKCCRERNREKNPKSQSLKHN